MVSLQRQFFPYRRSLLLNAARAAFEEDRRSYLLIDRTRTCDDIGRIRSGGYLSFERDDDADNETSVVVYSDH